MEHGEPRIFAERDAYLVLYKPAGIHCAPLREGEKNTLLAWCAERYPEVLDCRGRKPIEGGLAHRIDGETEGLVLVARTQQALDQLLSQQTKGEFRKEYHARCVPLPGVSCAAGFPSPPDLGVVPFTVESAFRAYGPGRRAVRPVLPPYGPDHALDDGMPYRTHVLEMLPAGDGPTISVRACLLRGFRHQVRCHLAWIGLPLISDELYGGPMQPNVSLGLRASALEFTDPATGEQVRYGLDSESGAGAMG